VSQRGFSDANHFKKQFLSARKHSALQLQTLTVIMVYTKISALYMSTKLEGTGSHVQSYE
jgi:hypothetical protein